MHANGLNPLASYKLYSSICLSSALYGCELWTNLSNTELDVLERAHRLCLKKMQGLPKHTRSDMVTVLIESWDIRYEIEKRKLLFLHRLCTLPNHTLARKIFNFQMFLQCSPYSQPVKHGFEQDIVKIVQKYNLWNYIETYLNCGTFPAKKHWKHIIKESMCISNAMTWTTRTYADPDFIRFIQIFPHPYTPSKIWHAARRYPHLFYKFAKLAKLSVTTQKDTKEQTLCDVCGILYKDKVEHILLVCDVSAINTFWNRVIDYFSVELSSKLFMLPDDQLANCMLGADIPGFDYCENTELYSKFMCIVAKIMP